VGLPLSSEIAMSALPLYFAYGSNLDPADLDRWLTAHGHANPLTHPVGPAFLPDHRYAYHFFSGSRGGGALDVVAATGHAVAGMLFAVHEQGLNVLDQKEGVPFAYARETVTVVLPDGSFTEAITYRVLPTRVDPSGHVPPTGAYHDAVLRGLGRHHLAGATALEAVRRREAPESIVDHVFVYGTLMRGEEREPRLAGAGEPTNVSPAQTRGVLYDLGSCGYPALRIGSTDGGRVHGELLTTADVGALVARLDPVEDFRGYGARGSLYERTIVTVRTNGDGSKDGVRAWTYVMADAHEKGQRIASGNWKRRAG
jgi:gamma-glutamylcyclotransferase (GGCT)/AIG2-like uncharacterized protein YtfP